MLLFYGVHIITKAKTKMIDSKFMEETKQAVEIENEFSQNKYRNVCRENYRIRHVVGTNNFMITAGHSVNHLREEKIKFADVFTGSIASILAKITGSHALLMESSGNFDPNFDKSNPFKERMRDIAKIYEINGILDIHGCKEEREFDVSIGISRQDTADQFISSVMSAINESGLIVDANNTFRALKRETITSYSSEELHIPCVQVEINRRYRDPINRPENFARILSVLSKPLGVEE